MINIREVSANQLEEVVALINRYWAEMAKRPQAQPDEKELPYWQALKRTRRILAYLGDEGELIGLLTVAKEDGEIRLDHLLVEADRRGQGIGVKLMQMADRMAQIWDAKRIILQGTDELEKFLPYFYRLGYGFHCPVDQKGLIAIEKRIS